MIRKESKRNEELTTRTCKLINQGKKIILKRKDGWYLHCWTNIAAGWDKAQWGKRDASLEIDDLRLAFAIAPLFKCKVYSFDPKLNIETLEKVRG